MKKSEFLIRTLLTALCGIGVGMLIAGCTTTVNFALINSRSPASNVAGTNTVSALTGMSGGGALDATIPIAP